MRRRALPPTRLRAALPGITGSKREDPLRHQCSQHLAVRSRAGRSMPRTARNHGVWPRLREPPSFHFRKYPRERPLRERDEQRCNRYGDVCQGFVSIHETTQNRDLCCKRRKSRASTDKSRSPSQFPLCRRRRTSPNTSIVSVTGPQGEIGIKVGSFVGYAAERQPGSVKEAANRSATGANARTRAGSSLPSISCRVLKACAGSIAGRYGRRSIRAA